MFEKVNPSHPDKIADRIAGALVDLAYKQDKNPRIAVEVLIGHGWCNIIAETSVILCDQDIIDAVHRIAGELITVWIDQNPQDVHLADNQSEKIRCGDNGIFKGVPLTEEEKTLTAIAKRIYKAHPFDGKYIIDGDRMIICQSNINSKTFKPEEYGAFKNSVVNPIGDWTGGTNVDTGATNRKLGSDMGNSVTGGGLHGKDLSKADVSVNIYAFLKAQGLGQPVEFSCAIGDETIDGRPYSEIVDIAREFIHEVGGFEKFAEWGLIGNDWETTNAC
jgi:S-adenosylmethionine synthetase